ncbi:MAG: sugar phosphate isomerase/epimerase [Synergistaceae bacterium]|nr:sugar phosphate isomerase/epimerase [Synergistaceae bacterium]
MNIGVRAHDYGKRSIEEMAGLLSGKGFTCVQLALPKAFSEIESYEDITPQIIERIRRSFEDAGIKISVLGCYMDIANPDDSVREAAIATFRRCLEWNRDLEASVVGTETAYPHLSPREKALWRPYMFESVAKITETAARLGVKAAVETVWWHPLENLDTLLEVMKQVNDERHLRLIFDASNLLEHPDTTDQSALWKTWLEKAGRYIEAMHIKDFRRDAEGGYIPTPLGKGVMDYTEIAAWLRKNRPDMPLLREEMDPHNDLADIEYLRRW